MRLFDLFRRVPKEPEPEPVLASDRFVVGDFVVLEGYNPWKGCIKVGRPYEIMAIMKSAQYIKLLMDNGTESWLAHDKFIRYSGLGKKMPNSKAMVKEYEEAMAAQELMDNAN